MTSSCFRQWAQAHQHHCIHTVLTNNVMVCMVHLFGDTENTVTIWGSCGKFLLLCLRYCQPGGTRCDALGVNVGSFCPLRHAFLLQGTVIFKPCTLFRITSFTCSFHHLAQDFHWWFLERLQAPLAVSNKGPLSFDQADSTWFAVSASALAVLTTATTAVIVFTLRAGRKWLAAAGSLSIQVRMRVKSYISSHKGYEKWSHTLPWLFDALLVRDDFYIADCFAETHAIRVWNLARFSSHQSCIWSGVPLSSWTRCCRRRDHWL